MTEPLTISFVGTADIKQWLEQSAKKDNRSVSYILRQILEHEMRRSQVKPNQETIWQSSQ